MTGPLRIALVNNRWFMVGGTTRYLFNVKKLLEDAGHTVVPFSNRYAQTEPGPYVDEFVDPPGDPSGPFYADASLNWRRKLSLLERGVYSREVRRKLESLIDRHRIDLVYSVNVCNFLGPSVIDAARSRGIPYVMRLSDFHLLCPSYSFLRDGRPCEDCSRGLWHGIKNRCLQDSVAVSAARVGTMWIHRAMGIHHRVTRMVTPTAFLRGKLIEGGYDAARIEHVPTFVDTRVFTPRREVIGDTIVFSGRLAPEKGPDTVLEAMRRLPAESRLRLVFLGDGHGPSHEKLRRKAESLGPDRVEFAGFVDRTRVVDELSRARALVMPARWYENMPNAVTEAMALGVPVLTSAIGSLPEQVDDGVTGRLLPVDDVEAWAEAFAELECDDALVRRWGEQGRLRAERLWSPELHYERLMKVFADARAEHEV